MQLLLACPTKEKAKKATKKKKKNPIKEKKKCRIQYMVAFVCLYVNICILHVCVNKLFCFLLHFYGIWIVYFWLNKKMRRTMRGGSFI